MSEELEFRQRLAAHERCFLRPERGDLEQLAGALDYRGSDPGARVWQRAIEVGRLPASWADDPQRRFRSTRAELGLGSEDGPVSRTPTPATARAALLFASDPAGLLAAERHARELVARLEAWGCPSASKVVWRLAGNPVAPTQAKPRSLGALAPALARLRAVLGGTQRIYEPAHAHRRFQIVVDALHGSRRWQLIAGAEIHAHGLAMPPGLVGRVLGELPNPFEPWLALALTGYGLWALRVEGQAEPTIELAAPFPAPRRVPPARDRGRVVWSQRLADLRLACARGDLGSLRRELPLLPGDDEPAQPRLIHFASYGGPEVLALLAEHAGRLDLEARDRLSRTALMLAAGLPTQGPAGADQAEIGVPISEFVGAEACAWLLAAGADREARDRQGWTALHWAAATGRLRCAGTLIQAGAKLDAQDHRGRTPLMLALSERSMIERVELIELLVLAGADADARDHHGWSALHYLAASTAGRRHGPLARRLVEAGARPSLDRAGRSPARLCVLQGVEHADGGPFDARAAVAAGPGAPRLEIEPTLVEGLLDQLVPEQADPARASAATQTRSDDWMVWADWLQSRGDLRGQLVATSLARARLGQRKQRRMANELAQLEQAAAAVIRVGLDCADPLAPIRPSPIHLTWTHGFVTAARLAGAGWEPIAPDQVEQTVHEAARMLLIHEPLLAELRLDLGGLGAGLLSGLSALESPSRLRRLVLGGLSPQLPTLDLLRPSFPALRSLCLIGASKIHSGALRWPGITHLRLRHGTSLESVHGGVELTLELPDLTHLDLALPAGSRTSTAEVDGAARTLSAIQGVQHLRLGPLTGDFAAAILACGLIPRLRTLELVGVWGSALEALVHHVELLQGLERVRVSITPAIAEQRAAVLGRLRRALPRLELDAGPQS